MKTIRNIAAGSLLAAAAVSVGLACCGAERALDLMKYHAACVILAVLGAGALAAVVCPLVRVAKSGAAGTGLLNSAAGVLLHLGFFLVLTGWLVGLFCSPSEGSLRLRAGQVGSVAGEWNFALDDFAIDHWPDTGTVRQYTSKGRVLPPSEDRAPASEGERVVVAVNHPLVRKGWWVYQNSYQEMTNPHTGRPLYFTILLCVKDVGLPWVAVGGVLLALGALIWAARWTRQAEAGVGDATLPALLKGLYALAFAGAVAMLVHRGLSTGHAPMQNMYEFLMCSAAFIPVLTWVELRGRRTPSSRTLLVDAALQALFLIPVAFFMDGRVKHLMPALQSPFFVPHVGAYVLGYIVLVRAALGVGRHLVGAGFFLLTVGLVLGATWGKVCWGHWWQFDPKEMWSLATWFVYAAYFHVRPRAMSRAEKAFLIAGAVMIVLTLTWINLSRLFTGMHSYA